MFIAARQRGKLNITEIIFRLPERQQRALRGRKGGLSGGRGRLAPPRGSQTVARVLRPAWWAQAERVGNERAERASGGIANSLNRE